ncbi:MAG: RNB domain-containing ribonuclease [Candidatus Micrarchaeia archaeon]
MREYIIYVKNISETIKEIVKREENADIANPLFLRVYTNRKIKGKKNAIRFLYYFAKKKCYKIIEKDLVEIGNYEIHKRLLFFWNLNYRYFSLIFVKGTQKIMKLFEKVYSIYLILLKSFSIYQSMNENLKKKEVDDLALEVMQSNLVYCIKSRKFFDGVDFYTVDNEDTIEFDDAIGVKNNGNNYEVFVAICDLSEVWNIHMDKFVLDFPQSLYTVDKKHFMLPMRFIEEVSLFQKAKRPVFLFRYCLDRDMEIRNVDFEPVCIAVAKNLNFKQGENFLKYNSFLLRFCNNLLSKRISNGAIYFDEFKGIKFVIQELMIFTNHICAKFLHKANIPFISRVFSIPDELKEFCGNYYDLKDTNNKILKFRILNLLSSAKYDVNPSQHNFLGLDKYTHVTSPIRRYIDVINQKQLISFSYNFDEFFTEYELRELLYIINPYLRKYNCLVRNYNKKQKILNFASSLLNSNRTKFIFPYYIVDDQVFIILDEIDEELKVGNIEFLENKVIDKERIWLKKSEIMNLVNNFIEGNVKEGGI